MYSIFSDLTPAYLQWTSNALLHLSYAKQSTPDTFDQIGKLIYPQMECTIPLNAFINRLLTSCIFLGWPISEEVLKIQDKYVICHPCPLSYSHCLVAITLIKPYLNSP